MIAIRPDGNVIDMTQRRIPHRLIASPAFTASLVDAIDAVREIAEIEPDPGAVRAVVGQTRLVPPWSSAPRRSRAS